MVPCMFLHHVEVTVPVQLTESPDSHSLLLFILMWRASERGRAYGPLLMHMLNSYYAGEESVAQHCCHSNQHWQQLLASLVWLVVKVAPLLCAGHRTADALCTQNRIQYETKTSLILQTEEQQHDAHFVLCKHFIVVVGCPPLLSLGKYRLRMLEQYVFKLSRFFKFCCTRQLGSRILISGAIWPNTYASREEGL